MTTKNLGLTLVELLVALAILALVASLAIPMLNSYREKSNDATAMSDSRNSISILAPQLAR
ncbi:prepilin-type N-terminal cleavage/methylation domain-containing protein [Stutzerimonas degradans]